MCCERFFIYARCGHPRSTIGSIHLCPNFFSTGHTCVNDNGQIPKDYDVIVEDRQTRRFLEGQEHPISGGSKAEIARGYKGYCHNCLVERSEPMRHRQRDEFLNGYLGEYDRLEIEREKKTKLVLEQERLIERFNKEKGDSEGWTEAE